MVTLHNGCFCVNYPPAQNQYMQEKFLGNSFLREYMRGLDSHSREYRKICLRNHFPHVSQILERIHFGPNTCRACIDARANTGFFSRQTIYVLVSCQGVRNVYLSAGHFVVELIQ